MLASRSRPVLLLSFGCSFDCIRSQDNAQLAVWGWGCFVRSCSLVVVFVEVSTVVFGHGIMRWSTVRLAHVFLPRGALYMLCYVFVEVPFRRKHGLGCNSDPPPQLSFIILPWHSLSLSEGLFFLLWFSLQARVVMTLSLYFCAHLLPGWAT